MATTDQPATGSRHATAVEAVVDRLARSRIASLATVLVVAVVCLLPGISTMPPLDGFESGHMVATREMVMTGDYATIRLQTADRTWHARGAYWAEALAMALAGKGIDAPRWVYRLPSVLAAIATAMLTWWVAMAFGRARAALLAGMFVAASGVVALEARLASADALLLAAIVLAAGALARVWLQSDERTNAPMAALFWTAVAVGVLVKGPVAPAMLAATVVVLSIERGSFGWLARLAPLRGIVWLLVLASPWPIAIAVTFLSGAAGEAPSPEALFKIAVPFTSVSPPGSYAIFAGFLAGPALTFLCLGMGWIVDNLRRPAVFFALAWAGPVWLVAELVETKLPQYVLPAIPAIAIVAATAIDAGGAAISGWIGRVVSLAPFVSRAIAAAAFPLAFLYWQGWFPGLGFLAFLAGALLAWVGWRWLRGGQAVAAAALSVVGIVFVFFGLFGVILPGVDGLRVGERVAALAGSSVPCSDPLVVVSGYPEETVVLAVGRRTRVVDAAEAADFLDGEGCRAAAVDSSQISSFRQRAEDLGLDLVDRGRVGGLNLRKMRRADVHLFTTEGPLR